MTPIRKQKIEAEILRQISTLILKGEVKDPRIQFPTMHRCNLALDGSIVDIYITAMVDNNHRKKLLNGLRSAAPFFQAQLSKSMGLRYTPKIFFHWDNSYLESFRVNELIDSSKPKEPSTEIIEDSLPEEWNEEP